MSDSGPRNFLAANQASYNRSTRQHWDHFAAHRRQVTDLLAPGGLSLGSRLCVLGAGNCNDLELPHLLDVFQKVTLVDIDADALTAAVQRQAVERHPRLNLRGGVDLTGMSGTIASWSKRPPTPLEFDQSLRRLATSPLPQIGGPFDVVLSPCLLSQICLYATDSLGGSHPNVRALRLAIRNQHLRQIVEWAAPGGNALLIIDLVTTDRLGSLVHSHRDRLAEVASRTIGHSRHFPGLDPASLKEALTTDPLLSGMVAGVQEVPPWLWALGPQKSFLVYAMRIRRSQTQVLSGIAPGLHRSL